MSEPLGRKRIPVLHLRSVAVVLGCALLSIAATAAYASIPSQVKYARGLIAYSAGSWDEAFDYFDQAVRADPEDALAVYYRGLAQARRGALDAAVADFRSALRSAPRLPGATLDLGVALFNQGQFADAQRAFEIAYDQGEEQATAAFFLGLSAYRLGEHETALRWFDRANQEPTLRQASLYYSGLASLRAGDTNDARDRFAGAATADPETEIGRLAGRFDPATALPVARAAVRARRPWSLHVRTGLEFDSNVVAAASDGEPDTTSEGDGRPVLGAGGSYRMPTADVGMLVAAADLSQSIHFDRRDFDLTALRLRLDWLSTPQQWRYGASVGYEYNALEYSGFSQSVQLQPWAGYQWNDVTTSQVYYGFRFRDYLDYPFDPFRDGYNNAFGVRQYWAVTPTVLLQGGYRLDFESPEDTGDSDPFLAAGADDFEYTGHELDVGVAVPWLLPYLGETPVRGAYRLRLEDFANPNSRARLGGELARSVRREDVEHTIAIEIAPRLDEAIFGLAGTVDRLEVAFSLIGLFNGSNLSEFDENRVIGSVGFRAHF